MKKIMISYREASQNGGPFNSHKRIMDSLLKNEYDFVPLVVPKGKMGLFNIKMVYNLVKQIKSTKPDAVQITGLEMIGFYLTVACKLAGVHNIILAIHGSTTEAIDFNKNIIKKIIMEQLEKFTLKSATITFGVSQYVKTIKNVEKCSKNYFGEIYNLLFDDNTHYDSMKIRREFKIKEDQIVIISSGRIVREKGYDVLLQIMKYYASNDNVVFIIIGDGDYKPVLEKELKDQIENGQVNLLGYRDDVQRILSIGDIFVMASYHETLCMSLIEAGQAGLALLASDVGGMREVVVNGESGYLIQAGDSMLFIDSINILLDNQVLLNKMKKRASDTVKFKFSNEKTIARLNTIYRIVLND